MSKKKTSKKTTPTKPPGPDADLDWWKNTMIHVYLPDASSHAERRHAKLLINLTDHLARELRAVRRAIEAQGGGK